MVGSIVFASAQFSVVAAVETRKPAKMVCLKKVMVVISKSIKRGLSIIRIPFQFLELLPELKTPIGQDDDEVGLC